VFELTEVVTLAKQINGTLIGKVTRSGSLENAPHKFVWYNRSHNEFKSLTRARTIGEAYARARWLFIPLEPGFTFEYFAGLLRDLGQEERRSAKGLLIQDQLIPGLANAVAQDMLFRARIHPRFPNGQECSRPSLSRLWDGHREDPVSGRRVLSLSSLSTNELTQ